MYFECPEAVAIRPSSDWPIWPTITRSSTVPRHRGAKTSVQTEEKSSRLLRNRWTNSSQVWGDANFLLVGRLSCTAKIKIELLYFINATIGHSDGKIIRFLIGNDSGIAVFTNAPGERKFVE